MKSEVNKWAEHEGSHQLDTQRVRRRTVIAWDRFSDESATKLKKSMTTFYYRYEWTKLGHLRGLIGAITAHSRLIKVHDFQKNKDDSNIKISKPRDKNIRLNDDQYPTRWVQTGFNRTLFPKPIRDSLFWRVGFHWAVNKINLAKAATLVWTRYLNRNS